MANGIGSGYNQPRVAHVFRVINKFDDIGPNAVGIFYGNTVPLYRQSEIRSKLIQALHAIIEDGFRTALAGGGYIVAQIDIDANKDSIVVIEDNGLGVPDENSVGVFYEGNGFDNVPASTLNLRTSVMNIINTLTDEVLSAA